MGQQTSNPTSKNAHFSNKKIPSQSTIKPSARHQGIMRIAKTPFQNCQKIQIGSNVYFLENTKTNLQQLIKYKARVRRYFSEEDVMGMIQNLVYTMAYLQSVHIPYPCLVLENIYVCNGKYKLLPPQTIQTEIYTKLKTIIKQKTPEYVPASPQLIIASRCQQPEIYEEQILFKSNIFAIGLILLEVCTLKNSSECYDLETYDILDQVVMERIQEIQGRYSGKIVRIIANMLDYDYEERMMPKDMSIWINRQLNEGENTGYLKASPSFPKNQIKIENAELIKSRLVQQPSKSPKASTQKLITQPIQTNNQSTTQLVPQRPKPRNSEQRINQIRSKIIKQRIKSQVPQQKDLSRSQRKKSSVFINAKPTDNNRNFNRNLPNPYLNPNHLNKSSQKPARNRSPYTEVNKDLGIHDVKKLRPNNYGQKYSYINQEEDPVSDQDRDRDRDQNRTPSKLNYNLKYKYNLGQEQQSYRQNSNRQKDGQRFIRVEKYLADFQRAANPRSAKKYDYGDILGQGYQNREIRKQDDRDRDRDRDDNRGVGRSPYRNNYQQNTSISDFTYQPPKIVIRQKSRKQSKQQLQKPQQQPQKLKPQPLTPKQNYIQTIKKQFNLEKVVKNSTNYQRHQQLSNQGSKPIKLSKQNEDIMMIKKQIERSKKLIQEVKRNEVQNSF